MDSSFTTEERLESLKAGMIGAIALGIGFGLFSLLHLLWRQTPLASSGFVPGYGVGIEGLVSGAIAMVSGFLFGATYRYIIRTDDNPHLKSGAIGAFGLIRGLSQADMGLLLHENRWLLVLLLGESMAMVAIAQVLLDWSIQQKWVRPFGISSQPSSPVSAPHAADP
ncbi:MAG: hypothetical protein AAGA75_24000 [Cyanobacteria bacterium P01_E01_bin.6]